VTSITFNPLNNNQAYLTTETQGLWMSSNMNVSTPTWAIVSSYPFRQPERVYFNPFNTAEMWVTSFGNGMKIGSSIGTTGMPVFANNPSVRVYPNPAKNVLNVVLPTETNYKRLTVYDISGRLITMMVPGNKTNLQINTETWVPGIYILYYGNESVKFVKE
jgi:hypothetical protein